MVGPALTEYQQRLSDAEQQIVRAARADRWFVGLRAGQFIILLGSIVAVLFGLIPVWLVVVWFVGFVAAVLAHERRVRTGERARRRERLYRRAVDRLQGNWAGRGDGGLELFPAGHLYAEDLDIGGAGSLFERISWARTVAGRRRLAAMLASPADVAEIGRRQAAIRELTAAVDLREELASLGETVVPKLHADALARWGAAPPLALPRLVRPLLLLLALCNVGVVGLIVAGSPHALSAALVCLVSACLVLWLRPKIAEPLRDAPSIATELQIVAPLLQRIERESWQAPHLVALQARLGRGEERASQRIAALVALIDRLEWRNNQMFIPIAVPLLWGSQHALAIEHWRTRWGASFGDWLDVVGEVEALLSLAGLAYEEPDLVYPELQPGPPLFRAEGLGHPLLPVARCVRNDVALEAPCRLYVISGSNMSGKSTLLRAIGVNAVLAQAGAPVRAARLVMSPLTIGASLVVHDSLLQGQSRFYAEIKRLRALMDAAAQRPALLFLVDEVLHGTNSHDRRIGAAAIARGLLARGAIGLMTTHDLALAQVAQEMGSAAANMHFVDHLEGGEMTFDYRLRPGVVNKSNALELMRSIGLEV